MKTQVDIDDTTAIKGLLNSYFDTRYKMMSALTMDDKIEKYFSQTNEKAKGFLREEKNLLKTIIEHRKLQINDLRYKDYSYDLSYKDIKIDGDTASVVLEESCTIHFKFIPDVDSKMVGLVHNITLAKKNNEWLIVEDKYEDEFKIELDNLKKKTNPTKYKNEAFFSEGDLEKVKRFYLEKAKSHVEEIKKLQKTPAAKQRERINPGNINKNVKTAPAENSQATARTFYTYNWYNAVKYAEEYALKINSPPWGNYESMSGDCTNFTSQCLYAGGIPFDTSGSIENLKWYWYSYRDRVPPWTGASEFNYYATYNNTSSSSNYGLKATDSDWASMYQGDIVQLGSTPYHNMFISRVVWSPTPPWPPHKTDFLICQHSTSEQTRLKNYPLSSKPTPSYYLSIKGYYK